MYSKIRRFYTDIHLFEFNPNEHIFTLTAETNRTKLSGINHDYWESKGKVLSAGINAGYFGWGKAVDTVGVDYRDEGFTFSDTTDSDEFIEVIYQDKKLYFFDGKVEDINAKYPNAEWALSGGYPLTENGKISLRKKEKFTHWNQFHPRTFIGQKANGNIVLCVAEGRNVNDKGLNALGQAEIAMELGLVDSINLDGGGSSEMIVDGVIKNFLGNGERAIATALLVYSNPVEKVVEKTEQAIVIGKIKIGKYFTLDEIKCRHCGKVKFPDYRLIAIADAVREHFGVPMRLVGFRCEEHNTAIGGDPNSLHMEGLAIDISSWNGDIPAIDIYNFIVSLPQVARAKLYSGSHVHIQTSWLK